MPSFKLRLMTMVLVVAAFLTTGASAQPRRPLIVDNFGNAMNNVADSICGTNKMLTMTSQDEAMKKMGTPIGIYKAQMDGGTGKCTGTLISKDLFLTAEHCAAECKDISVTFGFLAEQRQETFACKEVVEKGNSQYENDYMIVRLEGSPGTNWGWYDVSDKPVPAKSPLLMIHHPSGNPMKVSIKDCHLVEEKSNFLNHRCDTQPGSSGSAILLPNFENPEETRVVGVHTLGGCDSSPSSFNSGPAMTHLVTLSPLLKSMVR